ALATVRRQGDVRRMPAKISHGSQRRKRTLTARRNQTMPSRQLSSELAVIRRSSLQANCIPESLGQAENELQPTSLTVGHFQPSVMLFVWMGTAACRTLEPPDRGHATMLRRLCSHEVGNHTPY
ncbi:hypothetical protein ANN_09259, partial [Periplaneta americana]